MVTAFAGCGGKDSGSVTIAVPNDATNEARALLLLEAKGYIKLKDGATITATVNDIAENPHSFPTRLRMLITQLSIPTTQLRLTLTP